MNPIFVPGHVGMSPACSRASARPLRLSIACDALPLLRLAQTPSKFSKILKPKNLKPKISKSNFLTTGFFGVDRRLVARGGGSGEVEEGGVCAKRKGGRASHARGSRRGRAEAREHAGVIPACPGTKIGRIPKMSFPATFPSLPLNGLRLAHLA